MRTSIARAALSLIAIVLAACAGESVHSPPLARPAPLEPARGAPSTSADFPNACVAADHAIASLAGAQILAQGGNAVDAAVATSFTLSVVRPYSCGIGGGGFMLIHLAPDMFHPAARDIALNYRETSPQGIDPLYFQRHPDPLASTRGASAAAVPGTVAGLLFALQNFGTLDRAVVLAPAIRAAREGFRADADFVSVARSLARKFEEHPDWKTRFPFVWSRYLKEGNIQLGDLITNPEHAEALELIARDGANAFYHGPIADAVLETVRADSGVMSSSDLAAYTPTQLEPLQIDALGFTFLTMPPPSSGGVAMAQTLQLLDRANWLDITDPALRAHLLAESLKHAFADRAEWLADPAFAPVPVARLTSMAYLDDLARRTNPNHTLDPTRYGSRRDDSPATPIPADHGTSHLSVVDALGNAVSCTETINLEFGSLLAVNRYGFCLNNEMDDFLTRPGEPNAFGLTQSDRNLPAPGKRPLSSMSPTIVLSSSPSLAGGREGAGGWATYDNPPPRVLAVAGASGGPRIITATTQVLLNALIHDMTASDAVNAPRIHHQWMPDTLVLENAFKEGAARSTIADSLRARGHTIDYTPSVACVQLIRRAPDGHTWQAASDPRKGGRPAGN